MPHSLRGTVGALVTSSVAFGEGWVQGMAGHLGLNSRRTKWWRSDAPAGLRASGFRKLEAGRRGVCPDAVSPQMCMRLAPRRPTRIFGLT